MNFLRYVIFFGMVLLLSACAVTGDQITITPTDGPITSTITSLPPTDTPFPTNTLEPTYTVAAPTPTDTATPKPDFQFCSPLAEQSLMEIAEIVSDPYNPPRDGSDARHHGTDISYYRRRDRNTIAGEAVQALMIGEVVAMIQDQLPYGNMVIVETHGSLLPPKINKQLEISTNESLYILYAHFSDPPLVFLGDQVTCGQTLGYVGTTGYNIVNPHLHLETRIGPAEVDFSGGMAYYDTSTTETERNNYELWRTSGAFRHFDPMDLINAYLENWVGD